MRKSASFGMLFKEFEASIKALNLGNNLETNIIH
jgi:hypothetical protein